MEQSELTAAILHERKRIIGIVLRTYGEAKLAGAFGIADALDKLATEIEHGSDAARQVGD